MACANGQLDTVKHLVKVYHCDPRREFLNYFILHRVIRYAVHPNVCIQDMKYIIHALHSDPVSKTGHTPLTLACASGHLDTVKFLVKDHHCDLGCEFKFIIYLYTTLHKFYSFHLPASLKSRL